MAAELVQIYRNESDTTRTLIYPRTIADNVYITPTLTLSSYIKNLSGGGTGGEGGGGESGDPTPPVVSVNTYGAEDNKIKDENNFTITYKTGVVPTFTAKYDRVIADTQTIIYSNDDKYNPTKNILRADGSWVNISSVMPAQQYHVASIQATADDTVNPVAYLHVFPITSGSFDVPYINHPVDKSNEWFAAFAGLDETTYQHELHARLDITDSKKQFYTSGKDNKSIQVSECYSYRTEISQNNNSYTPYSMPPPKAVKFSTRILNIKDGDIITIIAKNVATGSEYIIDSTNKLSIDAAHSKTMNTNKTLFTTSGKSRDQIYQSHQNISVANNNIDGTSTEKYTYLTVECFQNWNTLQQLRDSHGMNIIFDIFVMRGNKN